MVSMVTESPVRACMSTYTCVRVCVCVCVCVRVCVRVCVYANVT
jgi:hypothetical protein